MASAATAHSPAAPAAVVGRADCANGQLSGCGREGGGAGTLFATAEAKAASAAPLPLLPVPPNSTATVPAAADPPAFRPTRIPLDYRVRIFASPELALWGSARSTFDVAPDNPVDQDLDPGGGFNFGAEYRVSPLLGFGPVIHIDQAPAADAKQSARTFALLASSMLHLAFAPFEFLLQVPVGICQVSSDLPTVGGASSGWGLSIEVLAGVIAWITPQIGVYAQLGIVGQTSWHTALYQARTQSDMQLSLVRPVLNLGVNFGF